MKLCAEHRRVQVWTLVSNHVTTDASITAFRLLSVNCRHIKGQVRDNVAIFPISVDHGANRVAFRRFINIISNPVEELQIVLERHNFRADDTRRRSRKRS